MKQLNKKDKKSCRRLQRWNKYQEKKKFKRSFNTVKNIK